MTLVFDLAHLNREFLADPFPIYHALREHDPMHRMADGVIFPHPLRRSATRSIATRKTWSSDKNVEFRPTSATARCTSTTPRAWCSTIRRYHSRVRKLLVAGASRRAHLWALSAAHRGARRPVARSRRRARRDRPDRRLRRRHSGANSSATCSAYRRPSADRLRAWSLAILGALEPVLSPAQLGARHAQPSTISRSTCAIWWPDDRGSTSDDEGEILSKLIAGSESLVNRQRRRTADRD